MLMIAIGVPVSTAPAWLPKLVAGAKTVLPFIPAIGGAIKSIFGGGGDDDQYPTQGFLDQGGPEHQQLQQNFMGEMAHAMKPMTFDYKGHKFSRLRLKDAWYLGQLSKAMTSPYGTQGEAKPGIMDALIDVAGAGMLGDGSPTQNESGEPMKVSEPNTGGGMSVPYGPQTAGGYLDHDAVNTPYDPYRRR